MTKEPDWLPIEGAKPHHARALIYVPVPPIGSEHIFIGRKGHPNIPGDEVWRALIDAEGASDSRLYAVEPTKFMPLPDEPED